MAQLKKRFNFFVILLALIAAAIRLFNINYASLWADELYSALLVRPGNSWYEILYTQRAYQPPGYSMVLWVWTMLTGYNEFTIRLLSVIGGGLAVVVSAYLGKTVKNNQTGLLMAVLVVFNPTQIWYSLEARFYIFVFILAALSLLLYWHLLQKKPRSFFLYFLKAGIDAALCYFHHFGILFVAGQFLFDLYLWKNDRDFSFLLRKTGGYILSALFYLPWVLWGLLQGLSVKSYWLKETDIFRFLRFNFGYTTILSILCLLAVLYFMSQAIERKNRQYLLFPLLVAVVTVVPVAYSLLRMPILVDRYAMILGPAFFLMLAISLQNLAQKLPRMLLTPAVIATVVLLSTEGILLSFVNRTPLEKQPWREMANWLYQQPDFKETPVYSQGAMIKGYFNLDFYLEEGKKAKHLNTLEPGREQKFYIVETNSVWQVKDSVFNRIDSFYLRTSEPFNPGKPEFGTIYTCIRK
jgi:4-amino-4-deoxy-L-arabinose transferase-like glycosyltransferase